MICKTTAPSTTYAFRLQPGDDLKKQLQHLVELHQLTSAVILSSVGSLSVAQLRLANGRGATVFEGPFEILSLNGTLGPDGLHLHIALSDVEGRTIGGHLLDGCLVHTTAELVVLELDGVRFERQVDPKTGYKELIVTSQDKGTC